MRNILVVWILGVVALCAMAQGGKFTLTGTFTGLGDSAIVLMGGKVPLQDTIAVINDQLNLAYDIDDATMLFVVAMKDGNANMNASSFRLFALPGEHATINGRDDAYVLGGSQVYVDYNEAMTGIKSIEDANLALIEECRDMIHQGKPQEEVLAYYQEKEGPLHQAYKDAIINYVKVHPDQEASALLLAKAGQDVELVKIAEALLTDRVRGSVAANLYKANLEAAAKKAEEEARQYSLEGSLAPDFTLDDINGKPLSLSSLRGKWVIVDFWGSWCSWCIKGMPKMKEYYAKYAGKLEILGVDCNDTVEKWKNAVAKHELPWLHVYWDKEKGDNPVELYAVRGFPTKVIVDPEGRVAKIIVGEDPAFYDYLDEVLK